MKKLSLKRMLEDAEGGETTALPRRKEEVLTALPFAEIIDLPNVIDASYVRKIIDKSYGLRQISSPEDMTDLAVNLASRMNHNLDMRARSHSPEEFLESELELDESLKRVNEVALLPELYPVFLKAGFPFMLVELINHANEDIALDVMRALVDLTDESVIESVADPCSFVDAFHTCSLVPVLFDNLNRFRLHGPDHTDAFLQICSNMSEISEALLGDFSNPVYLEAMSGILTSKDVESTYTRSLCIEFLCSILEGMKLHQISRLVSRETVDNLLVSISNSYHEHAQDAIGSEIQENLVDALCLISHSVQMRDLVSDLQGIELFTRLLSSDDNRTQRFGLRLIVNFMKGSTSSCNKLVERLSLKPLGKLLKSGKPDVVENAVTAFQHLLQTCSGIYQTRVLSKLLEKSLHKLSTIFMIIEEFSEAFRSIKIDNSNQTQDEYFLSRCERGLFTLQQACLLMLRVFNLSNTRTRKWIASKSITHKTVIQDISSILFEYIQLLDQTKSQEEIEEIKQFMMIFQTKLLHYQL
jgi:hypothetical protein